MDEGAGVIPTGRVPCPDDPVERRPAECLFIRRGVAGIREVIRPLLRLEQVVEVGIYLLGEVIEVLREQ